MSYKCNYCINKDFCTTCDKDWYDKFIPNDRVKKYFEKSYSGVKGINNYVYVYNSTNKDLVSTHSINIFGDMYCPYCGEKMFPIQKEGFLIVVGYCCICEGAEAEIEYEKRKAELLSKHKKEISDLNMEFVDKLTFCSDKLLDIKHKKEKSLLKYAAINHSHFGTQNGEPYKKIEQLTK